MIPLVVTMVEKDVGTVYRGELGCTYKRKRERERQRRKVSLRVCVCVCRCVWEVK